MGLRIRAGKCLVAAIAFCLATPALAWQLDCVTDRITDEQRCSIQHTASNGEGTVVLVLGLSDNDEHLAMIAGDGETAYTESLLLRVDDQTLRDFEEDALSIHAQQGRVTTLLEPDYGLETLEEMTRGETVRIRLHPERGGRQDWELDSAGLAEAWADFRRRSGF